MAATVVGWADGDRWGGRLAGGSRALLDIAVAVGTGVFISTGWWVPGHRPHQRGGFGAVIAINARARVVRTVTSDEGDQRQSCASSRRRDANEVVAGGAGVTVELLVPTH